MSEVIVKLELLYGGYCLHPEHIVHRNWKLSPLTFPALFAVIQHPTEEVILYDTGYSEHFFCETRRFPNKLYGLVTPAYLKDEESAVSQLRQRGIRPEDVRAVICSHFHADHVSALRDFPKARFLYLSKGWEAVRHLSGFAAVRKGVLPGLFPTDFESRGAPLSPSQKCPLPPELAPFQTGYDLFGDGSVVGVELPGHAAGQLGLLVRVAQEKWVFLIADAAWTSRAFEENLPPHPVTRMLFDDTPTYKRVLGDLHHLFRSSPNVRLVPAHCNVLKNKVERGDDLLSVLFPEDEPQP